MVTFELEVEDDEADAFVLEQLKEAKKNIKKWKKSSVPTFSYDKKEEAEEIKALLKSFDKVIDYFGGNLD